MRHPCLVPLQARLEPFVMARSLRSHSIAPVPEFHQISKCAVSFSFSVCHFHFSSFIFLRYRLLCKFTVDRRSVSLSDLEVVVLLTILREKHSHTPFSQFLNSPTNSKQRLRDLSEDADSTRNLIERVVYATLQHGLFLPPLNCYPAIGAGNGPSAQCDRWSNMGTSSHCLQSSCYFDAVTNRNRAIESNRPDNGADHKLWPEDRKRALEDEQWSQWHK